MHIRNIKSIYLEANKYVVALASSVLFFSCLFKHNNQAMDIADVINRQCDLEHFINDNFEKVDNGDTVRLRFSNPIFPYKAGFINKFNSLKFCNMSIQKCWVKKFDHLYAFFMIVKRTPDVQRNISSKFGKCSASALVTAQENATGSDLFLWRKEHLNIDLMPYFNLCRIPEYESCDLVICGNMTREQLANRED